MTERRTATDDPGGRKRQRDVVRGVRTALVVLVVLLVASLVGAALVAKRINESARDEYVRDAIPLATLVQDLVIQLLNQQTAVRGYVITTRPDTLKPYVVGRRVAARDLQQMQQYLPNHPRLADLVAEGRPRIAALAAFYDAQIALVRQGGDALELARARALEGQSLFVDFRGVAERMLADTELFVSEAQREHDAEYRRLVGYLAGLGAVALLIGGALILLVPRRLAAAYTGERLSRARIDRLRAVQLELTGSLREGEVRNLVTRQAVELFGAVGAAVVGASEAGLSILGSSSLSAEVRDALERDDLLAGQVRDVVLEAQARPDRGEPDQVSAPRDQVLVLTALGSSEDTVESLVLVYSGSTPDAGELATVATFGRQACQALENARLYGRELRIAETMQQGAMPRALPSVESLRIAARYLPGSTEADIGGDWFDVFTRSDGQVCAVVGDVGGKGVDAASQMGQLRSALRAFALDASGPSEVLSSLARFRTGEDELFATVAVTIIDPQRHTCRYALAGHPPPVHLRADGSVALLEGGKGLPLGVGLEGARTDGELVLADGDLLLLYTDGLVEKRTQHLGEGLDRLLLAVAEAPGDADAFLEHVLASMIPEDRRPDDIAVLALGPSRSAATVEIRELERVGAAV